MSFYAWTCLLIAVFSLGSVTNAQMGESCRTPNGEIAICKSIYSCDNLLKVLQKPKRKSSEIRFLRQSQCGYFNDGPLVCCGTDDDFMDTEYTTKGPSRPLTNKNPLIPDRTRCGYQESDKIFGGQKTALDEFPWMGLLEYENSLGQRRYSCAGTLISSRYLVTAAHCVTGEILQKIGRLVTVRLGEWNTDTLVDCLSPRTCNQAPVDIPVESAFAHEGYNPGSVNRYHDIALIRLKRDAPFSNFIRPICLPNTNEETPAGQNLTVAGWGRTETAIRSPFKLKLQVPLAPFDTCKKLFRTEGVTLRDGQLCAGGELLKDSCSGDSGGPLMQSTRDDSSQWYIEGIVSFGNVCGSEGWPGIYTKVTKYIEWIHSNVK